MEATEFCTVEGETACRGPDKRYETVTRVHDSRMHFVR